MQQPLLSVIVPTHNRQRYAVASVMAIARALPNSEIIVSDTSLNDELSLPLAELLKEGRVVLLRPGQGLTVVDNFNCSMAAARGEFLCFVGDDDFLHASAEEVALWAKANDVEAVRCSFPASYYWPDFQSRYFGAGYAARLAVGKFDGQVRQLDGRAAYLAALDNLGSGVGKMPRAYLGILSRALVDRICTTHGKLFGGVSPDIYSAALIANASRKSVEIDYPFIVPGSSGASTSGLSAKGTHKGSLRDNDHIRPFLDLQWDARVPEFYSVPTVWSFSLLRAAERLGEDRHANFARLYVKCLLSHPGYWRDIRPAIGELCRTSGRARVAGAVALELGNELLAQGRRVLNRLRKPVATSDAHTIAELPDCLAAGQALDVYLAASDAPKLAFR